MSKAKTTKLRTWKRWAIVARPDLGNDLQNDTYPTKAEAIVRLSILNKTHEIYRTRTDPPGPLKSDYGWRLLKVVVTEVKRS